MREAKTPPYVPLRALRLAAGLTLEEVSARISAEFPEITASRGTLSAIESGSRGVSDLMLRALERAFRIPEGSMTTSYAPRTRDAA
ncbi:helix-turn-helix domain-containing protein [Oerskovia rustica]|uniref:helix-turn-helix domain-containing protein n=1 Tax=Oerskovia rustica TaxID=2762237 RepID=UPI001CD911EF|nr:helix-turn-helix transcriptional regulator [Oerskovia rustica]